MILISVVKSRWNGIWQTLILLVAFFQIWCFCHVQILVQDLSCPWLFVCLLCASQPSLLNLAFSLLTQQLELFPADIWLVFLWSSCRKIHHFSSVLPRYSSDFSIVHYSTVCLPNLQKRKTKKQLQLSHLVILPACSLLSFVSSSILFPTLHLPLGFIQMCFIIKMNDSLPSLLKGAKNLSMPSSLCRKVFCKYLFSYFEEWRNSQLSHNRLDGNSCSSRAELCTLVFDFNSRLGFFFVRKKGWEPRSSVIKGKFWMPCSILDLMGNFNFVQSIF